MAFHDDLLAQATALVTADPGVPSQANLRRGISSAYYALFHLLIFEAVTRLIAPTPRGLRDRVSRSFSHGEMKQTCTRFTARNLSEDLVGLFTSGVPAELYFVAKTFALLQEARHRADYDLAVNFQRSDAVVFTEDAHRAFTAWSTIRDTEEANVFLTALAFGGRWSK